MYQDNVSSRIGVLDFLHWDHSWNSHHYRDEREIARSISLMQKAGIGWVRMDFLWQDIEPAQGEFEFDKYDRIVSMLDAAGIKVLGIFNYTPEWASPDGQWNSPPRDNAEFAAYCAAVIGRYKGIVNHWEIWNEPDSATYWQPQDRLQSYCRLLKEVYVAAKRVNPECVILNGGLARGIGSVNYLYENGAKDYFDVLNVHYFGTPLHEGGAGAARALPKLCRKIMDRNGDTHKKIWVTETGCPGVPSGESAANWWMGENPGEMQQAYWLRQVFEAFLRDPSVEKVFWAFFRDTQGHWGNGTDYLGIVRSDFTVKPGYEELTELIKRWQ